MDQFSEHDFEFLREHLLRLIRLNAGKISPQSEAGNHFIAVCKGKAEPQTEYERAFLRWLALPRSHRARYMELLAPEKPPAPRAPTVGVRQTKATLQSQPTKQAVKHASKPLMRLKKEGDRKAAELKRRIEMQDSPKYRELEEFGRQLEAMRPQTKKVTRKIDEPWGSREAWQVDRARNKYNGR